MKIASIIFSILGAMVVGTLAWNKSSGLLTYGPGAALGTDTITGLLLAASVLVSIAAIVMLFRRGGVVAGVMLLVAFALPGILEPRALLLTSLFFISACFAFFVKAPPVTTSSGAGAGQQRSADGRMATATTPAAEAGGGLQQITSIVFSVLGILATGYLAWKWSVDLSQYEKVAKAAADLVAANDKIGALSAIKSYGDIVTQQIAKIDALKMATYLLGSSVALGVAAVVMLLRRAGAIAAALLLVAFALPAIKEPKTLVFTSLFLIAAILAFFVKKPAATASS